MIVNLDFAILKQTAANLNPTCEDGVCPFERPFATQLSRCYVRYGIHTVEFPRIQAYREVTLRCWANGSLHFESLWCLHLQNNYS